MKVHIDSARCQGHGRCYDLEPRIFTEDEEGYGVVLGDGLVPADIEHQAHIAAMNCPEDAVIVEEN